MIDDEGIGIWKSNSEINLTSALSKKSKNITNITMVSFLITEFGLLGQRKKMIQFGIIGMSPHVADGVLTEK